MNLRRTITFINKPKISRVPRGATRSRKIVIPVYISHYTPHTPGVSSAFSATWSRCFDSLPLVTLINLRNINNNYDPQLLSLSPSLLPLSLRLDNLFHFLSRFCTRFCSYVHTYTLRYPINSAVSSTGRGEGEDERDRETKREIEREA